MTKRTTTTTAIYNEGDEMTLTIPSFLSKEEILDRIDAMKRQEQTFYDPSALHRDATPPKECDAKINVTECRAKMCEWFHEMVDLCHFCPETVEMAMSYMDRFCTNDVARQICYRSTSQYQLAAMTCLHLSLQMRDHCRSNVPTVSQSWSRGEYSTTQVAAMERCILHTLEWRLAGPTCANFSQYYLAWLVLSVSETETKTFSSSTIPRNHISKIYNEVAQLVSFQIQVAIGDSYFTTLHRSTVAIACIHNALEALQLEDFRNIFESCIPAKQHGRSTPQVEATRARILHQLKESGCQLTDLVQTNNMDWKATESTAKSPPLKRCSNTATLPKRTIVRATREKSSPVSVLEETNADMMVDDTVNPDSGRQKKRQR